MELITKDWLYNAGLVGFIHLLREADIDYEASDNILTFNEEDLLAKEGQLTDAYINALLKKYKEILPWNRIETELQSFINKKITLESLDEKEFITKTNELIIKAKKRFTLNSFISILKLNGLYEELTDITTEMRAARASKNLNHTQEELQSQQQVAKNLLQFLQENNGVKLIYIAELTYNTINLFWNDIAFRNVMKPDVKGAEKDVERSLQNAFVSPVISFIKGDEPNRAFVQCFSCNREVPKKITRTLSWLKDIGVNGKRKSSHFWNHEVDDFVCPLCSFIFNCLPLGFNISKSNAIFVNDTRNLETLIQKNTVLLDSNINISEVEEQSFVAMFNKTQEQSIRHRENEMRNIQIVKFHSQKNPPYRFNFITGELLSYLDATETELNRLKKVSINIGTSEKPLYVNAFQEILERLYQGKPLHDMISQYFRLFMEGKVRLFVVANVHTIQSKVKGLKLRRGDFMANVKSFRYAGNELKDVMVKGGKEHKLDGITYQLLNALSSKNKNHFIDIVVRVHISENMEIPSRFIDVLEDNASFEEYGYAFLLGLRGESWKKNDNKEGAKEEAK